MKRMITLLLCLCLLALCGCANGHTSPAETTLPVFTEEAAPRKTVEVYGIDEFLEALVPNTEIVLFQGNFRLAEAKDYGTGSSDYYCWEKCVEDGYGLQLTGLDNLVIRGADQEMTFLLSQSCCATVLTLNRCKNVAIQDLTLGHDLGFNGGCTGDVVAVNGCTGIQLTRCGFFGCGAIGISGTFTDYLTVSDCEIYECSYNGIDLTNCVDVRVENTRIHNLGNEWSAFSAASFESCKRITVEDCSVTDNFVYDLFRFIKAKDIRIIGSTIANNTIKDGFFYADGSVLDFTDNQIVGTVRRWYAPYSETLKDSEGTGLSKSMLESLYPDCAVTAPVPSENLKQVHVSNVDEFLAAIGSETEIILDCKELCLSDAVNYGVDTEFYSWRDEFDGKGLLLSNLHDLTIRSNDGNTKGYTITAVPRYAYVLQFQNCFNIRLSGFTAGHTQAPGECSGGVLCFESCGNTTVENCGLFGCGTLGVDAMLCNNLTVKDCEIYECSYDGIQLYACETVRIDGCTFRDLGGEDITVWDCTDVTRDGVEVYEDSY